MAQPRAAGILKKAIGKVIVGMMGGMLSGELMAMRLQRHKEFFRRTVSCFQEQDTTFRPRDNMLSVMGQVLHVIAAIELALSGVARELERFKDRSLVSRRASGARWVGADYGFSSMEWTKRSNYDPDYTEQTLERALRAFDETMDIAIEMYGQMTPYELVQPFGDNPMHKANAMEAIEMLVDHTAHHRGALAQYARLLGREPKFPYFELAETAHEARLA